MILTDAGPLVALIDRGEADHARCVAALAEVTPPLVTTWPAFAEAMYLLGDAAGWSGQEPLWRMIERGELQLAEVSAAMLARMPALMEKYRDKPRQMSGALAHFR